MSTTKRKTMQDFEENKKQQHDDLLQMNLEPKAQLQVFEAHDRPVVAKKQSAQQSTIPLATALPVSQDKVFTESGNPNKSIVHVSKPRVKSKRNLEEEAEQFAFSSARAAQLPRNYPSIDLATQSPSENSAKAEKFIQNKISPRKSAQAKTKQSHMIGLKQSTSGSSSRRITAKGNTASYKVGSITPSKKLQSKRGNVVTMIQREQRSSGLRTQRNSSTKLMLNRTSQTMLQKAPLNEINEAVNNIYDRSFQQKFYKFR